MPHGQGYLMEKMNNPKYPQNLGKARFPGGGIEPGETPQQAAMRELLEELGAAIDPTKFKSLGQYQGDNGLEEYLQLDEHNLQPGTYTASVGGDKQIELFEGTLDDKNYWGANPFNK